MGQRNIRYNSHMTGFESDQRGLSYIHPEPCVFYGGFTNFPQPNIQPMLPALGNTNNLTLHHPPQPHDGALFYGMTQYNSFQHQHPPTNLDIAIATSSNPYNPYMAPHLSASRNFPVPVNHGVHEQMPFPGTHGVVGFPADGYGRNFPSVDDARGSFKRKTAEGIPGVVPYHDPSAASSSSAAPMGAWPVGSNVTMIDAAPPVGNETSSIVESESHRSVRNRSVINGSDSLIAHNSNHLAHGGYVSQSFQSAVNPWLDIPSNHAGDNNALAWNQEPALPYLPSGVIGGGPVEAGMMGVQGYQITASGRTAASFMHPSFLQRHPNVHHALPPMQVARGHSINLPPQAPSSRGTSIVPLQGVVDAGPRYMGPVPPAGFRLYRPHQREDAYDMNARHRTLPHLRVLPEDGVAVFEVPGYHEVGASVDQHRDMRLDIDHMSYEELLQLGEQIGTVATGVSEEVISTHLKTRSFVSSATGFVQEEAASANQDFGVCVICQNDYKDQENVGTLDCGHEYHVDCVKKWLLVKNACPICKAMGLNPERKDV